MANEKEEESGSARVALEVVKSAGQQADPEIGQAEMARCVQKSAWKYLAPNVDPIMQKVAEKAKAGHEPSVKMLLDLALKLTAYSGLAELPPSFAAELWEISETLLADAEV
jgi:hypothetical protein